MREHHLVGEHDRLVELAVAIGVFEAQNAVLWILELLSRLLVRPGRIGDIEPSPVIEARAHWAQNDVGVRDELDVEAVRQCELVRADFADTIPPTMERLREAWDSENLDEVATILHKFVGSSVIVGFMELSAQAGVVYEEFKAGELSQDSPALLRLYEMARQIKSS